MPLKTALLCASAAVLSLSGPSLAATMTFDSLDLFQDKYFEDGINATAGYGQFNGEPEDGDEGSVHMDDSGTANPAFVTFRMGGAFSAKSFDLLPIAFRYESCDDEFVCTPSTFDNVRVFGYSGKDLIATLVFDMSTTFGTINLTDAFSGLTSLVIGFADPPDFSGCMDAPCSHFRIDNVVLDGPAATAAAVPLPAGLPLLAGGAVALGAAKLRRRRG